MKRDPALIPLTHDHHHALAQARRLRKAASAPDEQRAQAAAEFVAFYENELVSHFREEEELLFPLLVEADGWPSEDLVRVLVEHVEIHALVRRLPAGLEVGAVAEPGMRELSARLEGHIHLEERKLFPLIERVVPQPALGGLVLAPRRRLGGDRREVSRREQPQEEGTEGA